MKVPTPPLENRLGRAFIFTKLLRFIRNKVNLFERHRPIRSESDGRTLCRISMPGGRTNKSLQTCTIVPESISSPPPIPSTIRSPSSPWKTSDACQGTSSTIWSATAKRSWESVVLACHPPHTKPCVVSHVARPIVVMRSER
jgi:hypothetical protein